MRVPGDAIRHDAILDEVTRALRQPSLAVLEETGARLAGVPAAAAALDALEGERLRRSGKPVEALARLERSLAQAPELLAAYHCAALAHVAAGHAERARSVWLALLQRNVDDAVARYQIGLTYHDAGDLPEAVRWYEEQVRRRPDFLPAWYNLGVASLALGAPERALVALGTVISRDRLHRRAWVALGKARQRTGDPGGAIEAWLEADRLPGGDPEPLALAAAALVERVELPAAIELLDRAIALVPEDARLLWSRGSHLSNLGLHEAALADFRAALARDPGDWRGESRLLLELHYDQALATPEELASAHAGWALRHLRDVARRVPRAAAPGAAPRPLRVGYLSPRFGAGPLANFFLPVLRAHDRRNVHVTLYSAWAHGDPLAASMRACADAWRELPEDDEAATASIAADRLDLLVDLAGHAPGHRLHVLARKPAPVQATWLDYFDTTGIDAIDYLLSDATHTPAADSARFRERLVLLPGCRFVYAPVIAPVATPAPVVRNGHVTFGSFNRHAKITGPVLLAWKNILLQVPDARLQLRASVYRGSGTLAWLRNRWRAAGMPVERIDFQPYVPLEEAIRAYAGIDIALDTLPYNGGVTTCDALLAGVPVVTCMGDRMIARQSAALLQAAGHPEWAGATLDAYVAIAVALAQAPRLSDVRADLAASLPGSPLMDVVSFTATLERTLRTLCELGPRTGTAAVPLVIAA